MASKSLHKWIVGLSGVTIFTGLIGYTQHVDNNSALAKSLSTPNDQTTDMNALQGPPMPTTSVNNTNTDVKTDAPTSQSSKVTDSSVKNVNQSSNISNSESHSSVKKSTQSSSTNSESHPSIKKPTHSSSTSSTESVKTQPTSQVQKQEQVVTHQRIRTRAS